MLRYPGNPSAGHVTDALVSQLDVFPTLCDLADLPPPSWLEGHSLVPLLEGRERKVREAVYAEINYHAAYEQARCIRTERFKLIRRYGDRDLPVVCNVDGSPSKTRLLADGGLRAPQDREALYDLRLDPVERVNLAADPAYRSVFMSLSRQLDDWMRRTGDPLLPEGARVPKPAGARINRQDCEDATLPEWEE
jgi:arylsulfatase A-like enzyme